MRPGGALQDVWGPRSGVACLARQALVPYQDRVLAVAPFSRPQSAHGLPAPQALCPAGTAPPPPDAGMGEQRLRRMGSPRHRQAWALQTTLSEAALITPWAALEAPAPLAGARAAAVAAEPSATVARRARRQRFSRDMLLAG